VLASTVTWRDPDRTVGDAVLIERRRRVWHIVGLMESDQTNAPTRPMRHDATFRPPGKSINANL
jgi:hypothetical protein